MLFSTLVHDVSFLRTLLVAAGGVLFLSINFFGSLTSRSAPWPPLTRAYKALKIFLSEKNQIPELDGRQKPVAHMAVQGRAMNSQSVRRFPLSKH